MHARKMLRCLSQEEAPGVACRGRRKRWDATHHWLPHRSKKRLSQACERRFIDLPEVPRPGGRGRHMRSACHALRHVCFRRRMVCDPGNRVTLYDPCGNGTKLTRWSCRDDTRGRCCIPLRRPSQSGQKCTRCELQRRLRDQLVRVLVASLAPLGRRRLKSSQAQATFGSAMPGRLCRRTGCKSSVMTSR